LKSEGAVIADMVFAITNQQVLSNFNMKLMFLTISDLLLKEVIKKSAKRINNL
jgi:hypothetical protein